MLLGGEKKRKAVEDALKFLLLRDIPHARKKFLEDDPRDGERLVIFDHPTQQRHHVRFVAKAGTTTESERPNGCVDDDHRALRSFL